MLKNFMCSVMVVGLALLCSPAVATQALPSEASQEQIIFVEREMAATPDPNFYPGSNHYIKNGASEALFKADEKGEIQPSLAQGVKQIDGHTWHIFLRPEGRFWSGKEIDAAAVIASLERSRKTNMKGAPFLQGLSFKVLDRWAIEVVTERENLSVPLNLSYMELCIINADAAHDSVETMDMTGMYKVVEFEPKRRMVLEINPHYYGKKPVIRKVIHEEISDPSTRALAILSGRADIVTHLSNESVEQIRQKKDLVLHHVSAANTTTIYLNLSRPALKDQKVRQALSWGLDRDELVLLGSEGLSESVTLWLSSNPRYAAHRNDVYDRYNPEKAAALLDEGGWKLGADGLRSRDGVTLSFKLRTWGQNKALGEAVQHQWSRLGIKVDVQHGDYTLIETARETGDWDGSIEAWQTFGDEYALCAGQFSPKGGANYGGYDDSETNALLKQLAEATNDKERYDVAVKLNRHVAEQAPAIFIYPRVETTAIKANIKGFVPHFRQFENVINANLYFDR